MKKSNLAALLLGAALFLGLGVTTASAEGMKCGPGKCGSAMMDKKPEGCGEEDCKCGDDCECGDDCQCGEKKAPEKAMKCGAGKCGGKQ